MDSRVQLQRKSCCGGKVPQILLEREKNSNTKLKIPKGGHFSAKEKHTDGTTKRNCRFIFLGRRLGSFALLRSSVGKGKGKQNNTTLANTYIYIITLRNFFSRFFFFFFPPLSFMLSFHFHFHLSLSPSFSSALLPTQVFSFSFLLSSFS